MPSLTDHANKLVIDWLMAHPKAVAKK